MKATAVVMARRAAQQEAVVCCGYRMPLTRVTLNRTKVIDVIVTTIVIFVTSHSA